MCYFFLPASILSAVKTSTFFSTMVSSTLMQYATALNFLLPPLLDKEVFYDAVCLLADLRAVGVIIIAIIVIIRVVLFLEVVRMRGEHRCQIHRQLVDVGIVVGGARLDDGLGELLVVLDKVHYGVLVLCCSHPNLKIYMKLVSQR